MQPIAAGSSAPGRTVNHPQQEATKPITATLELKHKPESVPAARHVMRRALHDTRAFDANLGTDVLVDQDDGGTGAHGSQGGRHPRRPATHDGHVNLLQAHACERRAAPARQVPAGVES